MKEESAETSHSSSIQRTTEDVDYCPDRSGLKEEPGRGRRLYGATVRAEERRLKASC